MEDKKVVLFYVDMIHTFDALSDKEAGRLIKHYCHYINDLNPIAPDKITQIAFEPIKQTLKRDLNKWKDEKIKRSNAGKKGMKERWKNNKTQQGITNDNTVINPITNITDKDTVKVIVIDKVIKNTNVFIPPILEEVVSYFTENGFTKISAEKAFRYYNDADWKDSKGNKVRNWKQKMQGVWFKPENKISELIVEKPKYISQIPPEENQW